MTKTKREKRRMHDMKVRWGDEGKHEEHQVTFIERRCLVQKHKRKGERKVNDVKN